MCDGGHGAADIVYRKVFAFQGGIPDENDTTTKASMTKGGAKNALPMQIVWKVK